MFRLDPKRFRKPDLREKDIAAPVVKLNRLGLVEIHVLSQDRFAVDSLVVNGNLTLGDVVVNHHPPRTDNNHLAHFLRIQPADMNVGDHFGWVFEVKKNHVVDPFLHEIHALPGD